MTKFNNLIEEYIRSKGRGVPNAIFLAWATRQLMIAVTGLGRYSRKIKDGRRITLIFGILNLRCLWVKILNM